MFWDAFIVFLAALTIIAAFWEFIGNKLATSHQERRFIASIAKLTEMFDIFHQKLRQALTKEEAEKVLLEFEIGLLKASSWVLCGKHSIWASLMIYDKDRELLVLDKSNHFLCSDEEKEKGEPNEEFLIDLTESDPKKIGPAAMAFIRKESVVHLPKKSNGIGFIYTRNENGKFKWLETFQGWFPSGDNDFENIRSVLSVPVAVSSSLNLGKRLGVLNFTTNKKDLFTPRDYTMAICFASFAAQAREEANLLKATLA